MSGTLYCAPRFLSQENDAYSFRIMSIDFPDRDEYYGNVWQKVYRIIALVLLALIFLSLVNSLTILLGIPLPFFVVVLVCFIPVICWGLWKIFRTKFL
jgi:choline-glycine betaine transporter